MTVELTDLNFKEITESGVVVVDFWAAWCGPCRMIAPTLEEIAQERQDVVVGKLDVDMYPQLASKYGVMSIPTLLFFKDGELKDSSIGVVPKNVLLNKIDAVIQEG
ncbi:MAG: thioredoxin [Candidatus Cloacimonetes bacterium]|jgi:thioredoxin 1|nr:thioredoxin [Candidatus Cloacimonadota bacterium]